MIRRFRRFARSLVFVLSFGAAAHAQDARKAFKEGVSAFQAGDFATALDKFQQADAAAHAPAITYNIARTLEQLARPQDAMLAYERYLAQAGESGEFTTAAALAIAQIKARNGRLVVSSTPPGATVTLDGTPLAEKTPISVLVPPGSHRLTLSLDDWNEERTVETTAGTASELVFVRGKSAPAPAPKKIVVVKTVPASTKPQLSGLMGTAGISISAYRFVGNADREQGNTSTQAESAPTGLVFGLGFDMGYALSERTALVLRGFGGFGSSESSLASLGAIGPAISFRISDQFWAGGGVAFGAGQADSDATRRDLVSAQDSSLTFETDIALGPSLELSFSPDENTSGQWLIALMPTTLLSAGGKQSTLFIPLLFGFRFF
jgi:tetratricopeptide (TPR) repeat protein